MGAIIFYHMHPIIIFKVGTNTVDLKTWYYLVINLKTYSKWGLTSNYHIEKTATSSLPAIHHRRHDKLQFVYTL